MNPSYRFTCLLALAVCLNTAATGAIFQFDLQGNAGTGLLSGNENHVTSNPGEGGESGLGISYDDVSNLLTINANWGTGNGFSADLSGIATASHIHETASSAPDGFSETAE